VDERKDSMNRRKFFKSIPAIAGGAVLAASEFVEADVSPDDRYSEWREIKRGTISHFSVKRMPEGDGMYFRARVTGDDPRHNNNPANNRASMGTHRSCVVFGVLPADLIAEALPCVTWRCGRV